jgi:hypothetical protein
MRLALLLLFMLPSFALTAGDVSPRDFDMACAMATGMELGANAQGSETYRAAFELHVFYLGRLSGRDDGTDWNKVVQARARAELKGRASAELLQSCSNFLGSKIGYFGKR